MKLLPLLLLLKMAGFSATTLHLVSGEEIDADLHSLREKQVMVRKGDSATRLVPYDQIAAIRIDGKLHTEGLDRRGLAKLFPDLAPAEPGATSMGPPAAAEAVPNTRWTDARAPRRT